MTPVYARLTRPTTGLDASLMRAAQSWRCPNGESADDSDLVGCDDEGMMGRERPRRGGIALAVGLGVAAVSLILPAPTSVASPPAAARSTATPQLVIDGSVCPAGAPDGTLWDGSSAVGARRLCERAVKAAPTPQARIAIRAAFHMLGAPYACGDVGRMSAFRFDCSSLVSRAYAIAGIPAAGPTWSSSTRDMVPWDGRKLAPWAAYVAPSKILPGDLVLYDTGGATYRHVVMYIGGGYMIDTNYCGGVEHVRSFIGFPSQGSHVFLVARRVIVPPASAPRPLDLSHSRWAHQATVSFRLFAAHERAATIRVQRALNDVVAIGLLVDGRWDGGMQAAIMGFRRHIMNESTSEASRPPDWATLRHIAQLGHFTLIK